jgi:hypothetical protein
MKVFTFLLLIAGSCQGQSKLSYVDSIMQPRRLTYPKHYAVCFQQTEDNYWYTKWFGADTTDIVIGAPDRTVPAYKTKDGSWFVYDTAKLLKVLLWRIEQEAILYRRK